MDKLTQKQCVPCRGGEPTLDHAEIEKYKVEVPEWNIIERDGIKRLERTYKFANFAEALEFTNKIGKIADEQDHHPMIVTQWGKVTVTWWTHAIRGLHQNDFIMAAKSDQLY